MAITRIMIVAKPGLMRNSLLAFLRALPHVDVIATAGDTATALQVARIHKLEVVLVDMDLYEDGTLDLIRQLRHDQPALRSIILSDSYPQQKRSLEAGASVALLKGFLEEQLQRAVLNEGPSNSSCYSVVDREQIRRIVCGM